MSEETAYKFITREGLHTSSLAGKDCILAFKQGRTAYKLRSRE